MRRELVLVLALGCQDYTIAPSEPDYGAQPDELRPTDVVDTFVQRTAAASDVLFVLDASGSMSEQNTKLASEFDQFARWLVDSDVDWHVGVVTMTGDPLPDGHLVGVPPFLDRDTPYPLAEFADRVDRAQQQEGNDGCETGLLAARRALSEPMVGGVNEGFYREDALLTILIASDEEDHGYEAACGAPEAEPDGWARWALDLKHGDAGKVQVGVIGMFDLADPTVPADCAASGPAPTDDAAAVYARVLAQVPGASWSICADDWTPILDRLGFGAAGLTTEFDLRQVPPADEGDQDGDGDVTEPALKVELDRGAGFVALQPVWAATPDPTNPWDYDRARNAVTFTRDTLPAEGQHLRVTYPDAAER